MNPDKPVMKLRGDLIGGIGAICDPVSRIVLQLAQLERDAKVIHADIALGLSEFPRPLPDIAKHALMQSSQVALVEHVSTARERRLFRRSNIDLLSLIELAPQRDIAWKKTLLLLRC
jgi:hypothetical protein